MAADLPARRRAATEERQRMKTLERLLRSVVVFLGVTFVAQFANALLSKPDPHYHASWNHNPKSLTEVKGLAKEVVVGVVTHVERGSDLIVKAPGEPGGEDRIPTEVATIKIEDHHKGTKGPAEIKVFRTGTHKGLTDKPFPTGPAPPRPAKGAVERPAQPPRPTEVQTRTILLEDDPPYRVGERYALMLDDGPVMHLGGAQVKTLRPVSPEGRFHLTADNRVQPVSAMPFASQLRNQPRVQLENLLK